MSPNVNILKEKHIRITPQRLAVLDILEREKGHLTAEQIYGKIKKKFPAISFATVYSILELLKLKNLLEEIRIKFDKSCFELRVDPHHHFYCRKCGQIFDIDLSPCPALQRKEINGHLIEKLHGYFYGLCRSCQSLR